MAESDSKLLAKVTSANEKYTGAAPAPAKRMTLEVLFEEKKSKFGELLQGSGMSVDRFVRILINEVMGNDKLKEVAVNNFPSLIGACMEIAELGLDPSIPNEVFLIPYGSEVRAQTGYKGLAKLAAEAATQGGIPLVTLRADVIHENDYYEREYGDKPKVTHRPPPFGKDPGAAIGYVAVAKDKAGRVNFREMTVEEVKAHQRKFSKGIKNPKSPFADGNNFDAYGLKTVLRMLIHRDLMVGPKLARAVQLDNEADSAEVLPPVTVSSSPSEDEASPAVEVQQE